MVQTIYDIIKAHGGTKKWKRKKLKKKESNLLLQSIHLKLITK